MQPRITSFSPREPSTKQCAEYVLTSRTTVCPGSICAALGPQSGIVTVRAVSLIKLTGTELPYNQTTPIIKAARRREATKPMIIQAFRFRRLEKA